LFLVALPPSSTRMVQPVPVSFEIIRQQQNNSAQLYASEV
jgi:hypothetical protein